MTDKSVFVSRLDLTIGSTLRLQHRSCEMVFHAECRHDRRKAIVKKIKRTRFNGKTKANPLGRLVFIKFKEFKVKK